MDRKLPTARITKAGRWGKEFRVEILGVNGYSMMSFVEHTLAMAILMSRGYIGDCPLDISGVKDVLCGACMGTGQGAGPGLECGSCGGKGNV
jgi:hypothetical protein